MAYGSRKQPQVSKTSDQRLTTSSQSPISPTPTGIQLRLRVQPRASRTELIRLLADLLSVPRSAVQVVAGASNRAKMVAISGIGAEQAARRLGLVGSCPEPTLD